MPDQTAPGTGEPRLGQLQATSVAALREDVAMDQLTGFYDRAFHAAMAALARQGLSPIGPPVGIYFGMPGATVDVAAGFPIGGPFEADGDIHEIHLPAGPAVEIIHLGSYDEMSGTYQRMAAWMEEQHFAPRELMWETYETEPTEADPSTMRTRITWPIEDPN